MDTPPLYTDPQARLFLDTLLRHLPDSICLIFDHDLRFIEAQGDAMSRGGLDEALIVGRTLREALPAEAADLIEADCRATLTGSATRLDIMLDGVIYAADIVPVRDASGAVVAGMLLATDVVDKRQMTEQVRSYETIVENVPDAVYVYDTTGKVIYANTAAAAMLGLAKPAEMIGTFGGQWIAAEDQAVVEEMSQALAQHGLWRGRATLVGQGGKSVQVENVTFNLIDEAGNPNGAATFARDITDRIREEEQRAAVQRQVIDAQQAALRELSTPLIPLADNVVMMPLVGAIDSRRANQIMETLLEGVAANQADIALLDISGVRVVDTQVADALLRAAKAAKLLGTQIVLTGIKAEVAQTIVHLGADMTEIVTRANLQEGLRYALTEGGSDIVIGLR